MVTLLQRVVRGFSPKAREPSEGVSSAIVERIQTAQLDAWLKLNIVNVPIGILVATLLFLMVWDHREDRWLEASYGGIVASYLGTLLLSLSWMHDSRKSFDVKARIRGLLAVRFALGSCWAFALVAMSAVADPSGRGVLFGVAIGLMSTCVFSGPAAYAISGWLPTTAGAFGWLFSTGSLVGKAPLICTSAYAILTFVAILAIDKQTRERGLTSIRLERHAETIGLLLRDFEESASDWLWETDAALTLRHVSLRFAEAAQRAAEEIEVGLIDLIAGRPLIPALDRAVAALQQRLEAHASFRELVVPVNVAGERRWWALTGKPLFSSQGSFIGYRGVGSDVTVVHRSRERIAYLARHDELTGLANRAGFNEAIAVALAESRRQSTALLCLDLDEFKTINDSYGHDVGDAVLRAAAQRIRGVLRDHDLAARLGGDEFAILLSDVDHLAAAVVAARLVDCLSPSFACGDLVIKIGVSIGIAIAPADGEDPEILYRNADLALYRAKTAGRGTWRQFDPNMDRYLHERRLLQRDIRDALPRGELFVMYQPIVDLQTRELTGFEALVRWSHPERGLVPPSDFVPIAEQSGLIGAIGTFVLTEAADLANRLPSRLRIAVNLSPLQLRDEILLDRVQAVLDQFRLPPERIEFEVTELVMLETSGRSLDNLRGLRSRGHRVAIDDFGTGYSSLAALRGFPFDRLKIDRAFIGDLEDSEGDGSIVKAVIGLGRALGISITAEGVESERQATILAGYRCANGQGYYFARPLSLAQVLALVGPAEGRAQRPSVKLPEESYVSSGEPVRDAEPPRAPLRLVRPKLVRNS